MSFCRKLWFSNSYIFVTNVVDFVYFKIWIVLDQAVLDQAVWDKGIGNFECLSVYANSKKNFGTHAYCSMLVCESCLWFGTRLFPLPLLYPLLHLRNSRWVYDNPPPSPIIPLFSFVPSLPYYPNFQWIFRPVRCIFKSIRMNLKKKIKW